MRSAIALWWMFRIVLYSLMPVGIVHLALSAYVAWLRYHYAFADAFGWSMLDAVVEPIFQWQVMLFTALVCAQMYITDGGLVRKCPTHGWTCSACGEK